MFDVDDDDNSVESQLSSARTVTSECSIGRKSRRKSRRYKRSTSASDYSEVKLGKPSRRASTGSDISVSDSSVSDSKPRPPSLTAVQKASSYFKNKSTNVPPPPLKRSIPPKEKFEEDYCVPPFSTSSTPKEDFVMDEIASKYLFDAEATVDETMSNVTIPWEASQQQKKTVVTCYVSVCIAFIMGVFLMYGYYEKRPLTSEVVEDEYNTFSPTIKDVIPYLKEISSPLNDQALNFLESETFSVTSINQYIQRYILATLYYSTDGSSWTEQGSNDWLSPTSECLWNGIKCYPHSAEILEISLENRNLKGTLPNEIGHLSSLKVLNLASNQLKGRLFSVEKLKNLETLNLRNNQIQDQLPQDFNSLTNLQMIDLSLNKFMGSLSPSIGNLPFLTSINLSQNQLGGFFPFLELQNIPKVSSIQVDDNFFEGVIPDQLQFSWLRNLSLANNLFSGPLPEFQFCHLLEILNLDHNGFEGLVPEHFSSSGNLQELRLHHNQFQGNFTSLCDLNLNVFIADCSNQNKFYVHCDCCTDCF